MVRHKVIDNPAYRKAMKVLSIIAILFIISSLCFSLHMIIKYRDYKEFTGIDFMSSKLLEYFDNETHALLLQYKEDYKFNQTILWWGLAFFFLSGIPIWVDHTRDPERLLSKLIPASLLEWLKDKYNS